MLAAGHSCVFAATSLVISSRQDIAVGTALTFTTPCAPDAAGSGCAVAQYGNDCVYAPAALTLSRAVDLAAGATMTFNEAVPCPNATLCDYSCGYCASAPMEVRGQLHVADTVEFFAGQPNLGGVRTYSGGVDMALSTAASARVAGHLNVTNRSYAVAVVVRQTCPFTLCC